LKLKSFQSNSRKVKLKTADNKVITYRQHSSVALQLLVKSKQDTELEELMKYPLSHVPYSLGTADGYMAKTNKAKSFAHLVKNVDNAPLPTDDTLLILDGNALFHSLTQIPENFSLIAHKVFDGLPRNSDCLFSTDMYAEGSVKTQERDRRGCSEKLIIAGPKTKRPASWKEFLQNDDNKTQLIETLTDVWSDDTFAPKLVDRRIFVVSQGHCYHLEAKDGCSVEKTEIDSLYSDQEETDTRVVLYCLFAEEEGYGTVRVRSPDSDIFFILLHHAAKIRIRVLFDTGTGDKRKVIDVTKLATTYGQPLCTALLALHAVTHCDTTSAMKGIGKVKPLKQLLKHEEFLCIGALGENWDVPDSLYKDIERFTCAMYGKHHYSSVDELRHDLLKQKCEGPDGTINIDKNIDLCQLPPCKKSLKQHTRRSNYQVAKWKRGHIAQPSIPMPKEEYGWKYVGGKVEPFWFEGPLVPQDVAQVDDDTDGRESSDDESSADDDDDAVVDVISDSDQESDSDDDN